MIEGEKAIVLPELLIERLQKSSEIRKADTAMSKKAESDDAKSEVYTIHGPVFIEGNHPKALSQLMKLADPSSPEAQAAKKQKGPGDDQLLSMFSLPIPDWMKFWKKKSTTP